MLVQSIGTCPAEMKSVRTGGVWVSTGYSYSCNHGFRPAHQFMAPNWCKSPNKGILAVRAMVQDDEEKEDGGGKKNKQSLFGSITDALDFSQVRSERDAQLLEDARAATKSGERMSREQYAALRRKIGGTYQDFFKAYVEVDGEYVEEGWVDKTCKICKKDTRDEPRNVDSFGRYAHVSCLEKSKSGNFFTRLFNR